MNKIYKNIICVFIIIIIAIISVFGIRILLKSTPETISNNSTSICPICTYLTSYMFYQNITVNELKAMLDEEANITIVDVRMPEEYANGHIPNAINIPMHKISSRVNEIKGKNVVVYCNSGAKSKASARILVVNGVQNVWNLAGGLKAWIAAGYPIEK
ncbi:rhodanese-like domain-containing protein [Candidatus Bathyarchaeota archaeon]|nr:rhodanese-like domain-containing protein [Candidatus Bathyarchaeota archaeon]